MNNLWSGVPASSGRAMLVALTVVEMLELAIVIAIGLVVIGLVVIGRGAPSPTSSTWTSPPRRPAPTGPTHGP